jgi:hypothetical protein
MAIEHHSYTVFQQVIDENGNVKGYLRKGSSDSPERVFVKDSLSPSVQNWVEYGSSQSNAIKKNDSRDAAANGKTTKKVVEKHTGVGNSGSGRPKVKAKQSPKKEDKPRKKAQRKISTKTPKGKSASNRDKRM